jgi:hypothetical protein
MPKAELEADAKKAIKAEIFEIWPDAWHLMVVPNGFGQGGIPDHLACAPVVITQEMVGQTCGMFISVEAKRDGVWKASPLQYGQLAAITKAGGFAAICSGTKGVPELSAKLRKRFCVT